MLNNKILLVITFILTLHLTSCKKDDTGTNIQPVKDPRTYTWTADTLGYPGSYQTLMTDIWGSSTNDVYVVGHNSSNGDGVMWYYNGSKWLDVKLSVFVGGQIEGAFQLRSIYGFSNSNIYAAGSRLRTNPSPPPNIIDSSLIIHYDGSIWKKVDIYGGSFLSALYGKSANDIWAGGWGRKTYHYNGSKWETDSINIVVQPDYFFGLSSIGADDSNIYAVGGSNNNNTGNTINYLFKRLNNNWVAVDSFLNINYKFGIRLNKSKLQNLYSYGGGGIYKYDGTAWSNFYPTSYPISSMWGTSNENIFAVDGAGGVFHYNGVDWKKLEFGYPTDYWAVWTDGTEAFVVGHINDGVAQKTIVWHGK